MAHVQTQTVDIPAGDISVRALVARPKDAPASLRGAGRLPAVVAWSDIFQLTDPHVRICRRLAGYGFVVVAPEIYARIEPPGSVLDFDKDRQRALDDSSKVQLAWVDDERAAVLSWMRAQPYIDPARLGALGWCFGGHVAMRAALEPDVKATACCYPTGVHNGNLGAAADSAGTLERLGEIKGSLLLVWGRGDPHIPAEGRNKIHRVLEDKGVRHDVRYYDAVHTFMRDVGDRHEPEAADRAFADVVDLYRRTL